MLTATFKKYTLTFKNPAGTSRGVLYDKECFILYIQDENGRTGRGECNLFRGLSPDDVPDYEEQLVWLCTHINLPAEDIFGKLKKFPSILFGYEQAVANLMHGGSVYFPSNFTEGKDNIRINGLIWMGTVDYMRTQIQRKISDGFDCIKLNIGTDWPAEFQILSELRKDFPASALEIRVDANGAFSADEAPKILDQLASLQIHSIEQPIKAGQSAAMARLCHNTPVPVALDEELIGVHDEETKHELLDFIRPQYIILKPALVGGFRGADSWIAAAENLQIGWWITSALESNIGLNALAQYTYRKHSAMPQGLGTGALYVENFPTPLRLDGQYLSFEPSLQNESTDQLVPG